MASNARCRSDSLIIQASPVVLPDHGLHLTFRLREWLGRVFEDASHARQNDSIGDTVHPPLCALRLIELVDIGLLCHLHFGQRRTLQIPVGLG